MVSLLDRYSKQIAGKLSCFDRMVVMGTLPDICHKDAISRFLYFRGVRVFDFGKTLGEPWRDLIHAGAERVAKEAGLKVEFLRCTRGIRKENEIQAILASRPEAERSQPGLVHIFSAMEGCTCYKPRHDKGTGKSFLVNSPGKCLHYYFYFIDPDFGLCYLRVPTWAPFRLQFYCNGHNWLANQMTKEGITFTQMDNAFSQVSNWPRAQELADSLSPELLHRVMDEAAARYCPVVSQFEAGYHWSIMQVEYSTDIAFKRQADLAPLYEGLTHTAIHAVKPEHVATFLGRKLTGNYTQEIGNDFHTRIQGTCIKHRMGASSLKMYDKAALVLRLETSTNDVSFFKHYREVEHRDGTVEKKMAEVQKTIYSLGVMRELLGASNQRYLAFLSDLTDPTAGVKTVEKLASTVKEKDRTYKGFNLFQRSDLDLFVALAQGQWNISGFQNATLRRLLPKKTGAQLSRILKRMRLHGLIKKVGHTYKYYLTTMGRNILLTALKLRELVVIPSLAALLPI